MEVSETELKNRGIEIVNIFTTPFLFHSTEPSNLESIVAHGIVSPGFNERARVVTSYRTKSEKKDYRGVFLSDPTQELPLDKFNVGEIVQRTGRTINKHARIAVLVDPSINTEPDSSLMSIRYKDSLRFLRVSPKFLRGVVADSFSIDEIERIKMLMSDIAKKYPFRALPIYTSEGDLIWPKNVTNQEIKRSVEQS